MEHRDDTGWIESDHSGVCNGIQAVRYCDPHLCSADGHRDIPRHPPTHNGGLHVFDWSRSSHAQLPYSTDGGHHHEPWDVEDPDRDGYGMHDTESCRYPVDDDHELCHHHITSLVSQRVHMLD
eukprot:PhF_6_TR38612/c2_g1_i1/m.57496